MKTYKLSSSKLNLFLECPLCFWLESRGVHRPRGIFPSLPGGMDLALKKYYDKYRKRGKLPPEIAGEVEGKLLDDVELMKRFRNWRRFSFEDKKLGVVFYGALDDCLVSNKGYIPVDFKTRGFELKEDTTEFYRNQLDCYALLLERNQYRQAGFAYLIYYIPKEIKEKGRVVFNVRVKKMKTDPERALRVLKRALKVLRGKKPKFHSECEYCSWGNGFVSD